MAKKIVKTRKKKELDLPEVTAEQVAEVLKTEMTTEVELSEVETTVTIDNKEYVVGLDLANKEETVVDTEVKIELPKIGVREAVVNIAGSTPTKDFAISVCKFFDEYPNSVLRVRAIGAGSGHQLTKATIEANKMLISRGQVLARFDFWSNEKHIIDGQPKERSVNNTRLVVVDVMPNSLAQALSGKDVDYIPLDVFVNRDKEGVK